MIKVIPEGRIRIFYAWLFSYRTLGISTGPAPFDRPTDLLINVSVKKYNQKPFNACRFHTHLDIWNNITLILLWIPSPVYM